MAMSSSRPYLLRAIYEWITENECTPHIAVDAFHAGVLVPQEYVRNGQIVLNLATSAVRDLFISSSEITFSARFNGIPMDIHVPIGAVLSIYAKENGQGMIFEPEPPSDDPSPQKETKPEKKEKSLGKSDRPTLRVIK